MFDLGVKEDTSILNLSWNECNSGIGLLETVNVKQWEGPLILTLLPLSWNRYSLKEYNSQVLGVDLWNVDE